MKWEVPVWTVAHAAEQKVVETLKASGTAAIQCIRLRSPDTCNLLFDVTKLMSFAVTLSSGEIIS